MRENRNKQSHSLFTRFPFHLRPFKRLIEKERERKFLFPSFCFSPLSPPLVISLLPPLSMDTTLAVQNYNGGIIVVSYLISVVGAQTTLELLTQRTHIHGLYNW